MSSPGRTGSHDGYVMYWCLPCRFVFQSHDVILAQVVAALHFDNVHGPSEYVDLNSLLPVTDDLMLHFDWPCVFSAAPIIRLASRLQC